MQRDARDAMALEPGLSPHEAGLRFLQRGLNYTTGHEVPVDLVTAHMWFNVAAMLGNEDAIRLRREIAAEMSAAETTTALRAARDWITTH